MRSTENPTPTATAMTATTFEGRRRRPERGLAGAVGGGRGVTDVTYERCDRFAPILGAKARDARRASPSGFRPVSARVGSRPHPPGYRPVCQGGGPPPPDRRLVPFARCASITSTAPPCAHSLAGWGERTRTSNIGSNAWSPVADVAEVVAADHDHDGRDSDDEDVVRGHHCSSSDSLRRRATSLEGPGLVGPLCVDVR